VTRWRIEVIAVAERELRGMPADIQADFLHLASMLEEAGPQRVGMPLVRHLEGKLWEMRLRGQGGIARAVYFSASEQRLIVVRFFTKKTRATPRYEIRLALRRMAEFEQ
jgi:phage-related protein